MDDIDRHPLQPIKTLESEFLREEDELRRWLDLNVTDPEVRGWYLAQLQNDYVIRGRRVDLENRGQE